MLEDGTYEAMVVDVDDDAIPEVVVLSLAVTSGPTKGELVEIHARRLDRRALDLLAMPCILVVTDGTPSVVFD